MHDKTLAKMFDHTTKVGQSVFSLVEKYKLYVLPLHSIDNNNICTCGNIDCGSPGKHPFFKYNWKKIASNDVNKIKEWINKYDNINWAILTGRQSPVNNQYLVVIDVDKREHRILNELPNTFSYSTGNGYHFWYWSDTLVSNSVSIIEEHVDIRGSNGYVVVPPSKHKSGKRYMLRGQISDIELLPKNIMTQKNDKKLNTIKKSTRTHDSKIIRKQKIKISCVNDIRKQIKNGKKIKLGERNNTIFRLLCSDRSKGMSENDLLMKAISYKEHCQDKESVTSLELTNIIKSAMKYPPNNTFFKHDVFDENDLSFIKFIKHTQVCYVTLEQIIEWRKSYYNKLSIKDTDVPHMSYQGLSKLLKDNNLKTKRIKDGNVWFCQCNI